MNTDRTEDSVFEDGRAVRFFRALTDAAPEAALRALQRAIGDWEFERLKQLTGDSRRYIVWSLEAIAVWRELFADAARLLLASPFVSSLITMGRRSWLAF